MQLAELIQTDIGGEVDVALWKPSNMSYFDFKYPELDLTDVDIGKNSGF